MPNLMSYYFATLTCGDDWTQVNLANVYEPFEAIAFTNDDADYSVIVVLNDLSNDEIEIKAGESMSINANVIKFWYKTGTAGQTPAFRVVAD